MNKSAGIKMNRSSVGCIKLTKMTVVINEQSARGRTPLSNQDPPMQVMKVSKGQSRLMGVCSTKEALNRSVRCQDPKKIC
jgi:hypothetical protein